MSESTEKPMKAIEEYEHEYHPQLKTFVAVMIGFTGTVILAWILGSPLEPVMSRIEDTNLYHFIPFFLSFIVFVVLLYKAYVKKIKGLEFIATAVLLHGLAEGLNIIRAGEGSIFQREYHEPLDLIPMITDLFVPLAIVLLYLHIELTDKLRPEVKHAVGIIGTAAPLIVGGFLIIILRPFSEFDSIREDVNDVILIYLGLFALIVLWISLFGLRVMYKTLKHADTPEIARGSVFVIIGFASLMTNFLLLGVDYSSGLRDDSLLFNGQTFIIHNSWLLTFSLVGLLIAYIWDPEFAYSVPFDVYQLLVINSDQGVTLFSFVNEIRQEGQVTHAALKSPAIVAIQNLVQEIASAEGHIILIGMSDRILILKTKNQIVSVLISQRNSYFINKGLEDFTNGFYKNFENHINNFIGNVNVFKDANKLIRKHLPFMRKESLIQS